MNGETCATRSARSEPLIPNFHFGKAYTITRKPAWKLGFECREIFISLQIKLSVGVILKGSPFKLVP